MFSVQLYNFRKELTADFKGTLQRIAALGFDGVEFACYYGDMPPQELADFLQEIDLKCAGTMFSMAQLADPDDPAWEYAEKLASPAVTISTAPAQFRDNFQEIPGLFTAIAANAAAKGKVFTYHNHWWEFDQKEKTTALEWLIAGEIPNFYLEADICWLTAAGIDPAAFIGKYAKIIRQLHFKDILVPQDAQTTTELGCGIVQLREAYQAAKENHISNIIYEQDHSDDPWESAVKSLNFLKNI